MMDVYFDLDNTIAIHRQKPASEVIENGLKAIKRHCSIFFNFTKEEAKNEPAMHDVIRQFTDGVPNEIKFLDSVVPERPLKSNFHNHIDNKQSIFFINTEIEKGKQAGSLMICDLGDENSIFELLFLNNHEYRFERNLKIGKHFCKWADLQQFNFPFTDMIVIDQYLFSSYSDAVHNLDNLFFHMHKNIIIKTNIILMIKNGLTDTTKTNNDFVKIIKDSINRATGAAPRITVIEIRDIRGIPSLAEHDRTIFSNYLRIYSGDSFTNYFNADNTKKSKGREIHFSSLIHSENFDLSQELLKDLQKTIIWLEKNNPDAIKGDKTSNFLKFSD